MDDGTEMELGPGDAALMDPGHDAWVVGDELNVLIELVHVLKSHEWAFSPSPSHSQPSERPKNSQEPPTDRRGHGAPEITRSNFLCLPTAPQTSRAILARPT